MSSVLQDWVHEIPLRAQGTLLTGVRNCDVSAKHSPSIQERYGCSTGECSPDRQLIAFLRYCFMNPADPREVDVKGSWFQSKPPADWKPSQFGHFPQHWYSHVTHCFEVVGYFHPVEAVRKATHGIYVRLVENMHLTPETKEQMVERLTEDRIESGKVVS